MATEVIMPQMGESIFEGTITKWLKKVGDTVQKDEPLFEISTDKVDAEIPSPVAGTLTEIKVVEGTTVQINTVVALVGETGEATSAASKEAPKADANAAATAPVAKKTAADGAAASADSDALAKAKTDASEKPAAGAVTGGTDVVMPQMGESIFEGTITKWLKKVGDAVQKDEPLFEISTDKVDAEIPAPIAGKLSEIKVPEGTTVQINTVVAVIGGSASGAAASAPAAAVAAVSAPAAVASATANPSAGTTDKLRSSPLVRRIAKDNNLDLRQIAGTGTGGRITKDDTLKFLATNGAGSTAPAASAPVASTPSIPAVAQAPAAVAATAATPAQAKAPAVAAPVATPVSEPLSGELVPLSKMRSIIAQRMVESAHTSPHVHTVFKVDMTRIAKLREKEKGKYEQRNGVKLTYMPFIAAAAVQTLRKFPIVNASLETSDAGMGIRYHKNINLGIAVALEWGLIVPVIKQAEERSFLGLARAVADLAERARGKKLKPDEVSGSTFTLTNSGIFGEEFGTPIINQPDSAILAIGGLKKEPIVITDAEGNDTIAIRWTQNFCLGFDHRTIDGADAGKFMAEFKKTLENWSGDIS
ncbi:2-oxo acid dehydrogenase subunit E2 [Acidicapsa ligni]|uniref:2-oxo acid dehydrogenase subunit E2 n=1 Tax=Acidicapsa ligni TaxID=542300 RepID=UPI0021E0A98D|nr:2-oxo acid dehydrogenase subunit E2 [Acidicapsa ligni]